MYCDCIISWELLLMLILFLFIAVPFLIKLSTVVVMRVKSQNLLKLISTENRKTSQDKTLFFESWVSTMSYSLSKMWVQWWATARKLWVWLQGPKLFCAELKCCPCVCVGSLKVQSIDANWHHHNGCDAVWSLSCPSYWTCHALLWLSVITV